MALAAPDTLTPSDRLTIAIRAVEGSPSLKNGMRLRALFGTCESETRLRLLDRRATGITLLSDGFGLALRWIAILWRWGLRMAALGQFETIASQLAGPKRIEFSP